MRETEAQFAPVSNQEQGVETSAVFARMAKSKALGSIITISAAGFTEAQVTEVTCPKHTQALKFPAWWAPYSSSRHIHSSEPTIPGQTLTCLFVNHLGDCVLRGSPPCPTGTLRIIPHIPTQGPANQSLGKHLSSRGKNMLGVTSKPPGDYGTTDWSHQVPI